MTEGKLEISTSRVIEELTGYSKSRYFTQGTQDVFAAAVELLRNAYDLPLFDHVHRPGDFAVKHTGVEVQTSQPIKEGDRLTIYVEEGGKIYARPDDEFRERFKPKA
jgi:hypothetical protein